MRRLVGIVKDMRSSIQNVVAIAEGVKGSMTAIVHSPDHGGDTNSDMFVTVSNSGGGGSGPNGSSSNSGMNILSNSYGSDAFEQEKKLAELIANAFQERNEARMRYKSLSEFLEKYNLDEKDSLLLENYNFEMTLLDQQSSSSPDWEHNIKEGMAFLNALQRISMIRKKLSSSFDSSLQLTSMSSSSQGHDKEKGQSTFGNHMLGPASAMRMLENLASKQERAFERLYHFLHSRLDLAARSSSSSSSSSALVQSNIKIQDDMDETLLHPFIQRAIYVLRQVPAYYRHTLELIASSRRAEVTRKFLLALTSGYDGMAPMEMKAHDPVNYVGDMLAFVFRTLSVESELAKGLFVEQKMEEEESAEVAKESNEQEGEKDDIDSIKKDDDMEDYPTVTAMNVLNDVMSGVARPLRSRLSHIIASLSTRPEEDGDDHLALVGGLHEEEAGMARNRLASLYSICGLLFFYQSAVDKALKKLENLNLTCGGMVEVSVGDQVNPLVQCMKECLSEGAKGFAASVKVYVATLESFAASSGDTQAAVASEMMLRLCKVRSASPGFGIVTENIDEETITALSVEFLCDHVFEPVFPLCSNLDDVVSMKGALSSMTKVGLERSHTSKWNGACAEKEKMLIDIQIESDVKDFFQESSLGGICSAMEKMEALYVEGMAASSHPGLSEESLRKAIEMFYATLYDPPIPSYTNVKDPILRKYAKNNVVENVIAIYEKIYDLAHGEKGGYSDVSFFKYDSNQVKAMLSS